MAAATDPTTAGRWRAPAPVAESGHTPALGSYFRRWVEGSGISLEANTADTPGHDLFYVLASGVVHLGTDDYAVAATAYHDLCVAYWEAGLGSADLATRLAAARGLFRHDQAHPVAGDLLATQGDSRDRDSVTKARHRAALKLRQGR